MWSRTACQKGPSNSISEGNIKPLSAAHLIMFLIFHITYSSCDDSLHHLVNQWDVRHSLGFHSARPSHFCTNRKTGWFVQFQPFTACRDLQSPRIIPVVQPFTAGRGLQSPRLIPFTVHTPKESPANSLHLRDSSFPPFTARKNALFRVLQHINPKHLPPKNFFFLTSSTTYATNTLS